MRKFRLIKLYPNSPPLGTEVNYSETHQIYNYNGGNYYTEFPKHQIENLPEFWQELKEPILTTEDGYECTLNDRIFGVLPKANWQTNYYGEKGVPVFKLFNPEGKRWNLSSEWLWFKTKENAEKYIYDNKPEFSRKQIKDILMKSCTEDIIIIHKDELDIEIGLKERIWF